MLSFVARSWKASRLRHGETLIVFNHIRHLTSTESAYLQQSQKEKVDFTSAHPAAGTAPALTPPTEPAPEECCGKGCEECVWTVYWNDLREYQIAEAEAQGIERALDPFEELERRLAAQQKENQN